MEAEFKKSSKYVFIIHEYQIDDKSEYSAFCQSFDIKDILNLDVYAGKGLTPYQAIISLCGKLEKITIDNG